MELELHHQFRQHLIQHIHQWTACSVNHFKHLVEFHVEHHVGHLDLYSEEVEELLPSDLDGLEVGAEDEQEFVVEGV